MKIAIVIIILCALAAPVILYLRRISEALRRLAGAREANEGQAEEAAPEETPAPAEKPEETGKAEETPPAKEEDDDDPTLIGQLRKRGFVVWLDEQPPKGRLGIGDLAFSCTAETDVPGMPCDICDEVLYEFAEAVERPKSESEEPRWCVYGAVCLCCGYLVENDVADFSGFFGPLFEECGDFQGVFDLLDDDELKDGRKLLARREANAMRQALTFRSQRKSLDPPPPKDKTALVRKFVKPAAPPPVQEKKDDDPA